MPTALDIESLLSQSNWIHELAARLLRDRHAAEDVVQETWVAALQSDRRPRDPSSLRRWLTAVTRNLALRRRQREATRRRHEELSAGEHRSSTSPGDELERVQLQKRLAEELLALDEPYRTAVVLRHVEGLRHRVIAERQGVSEAAVRQRVSRGLAVLRARLEESYGAEGRNWIQALSAAIPSGQAGLGLGLGAGGLVMGGKALAVAVIAGLGILAYAFWPTPPESSDPAGGALVGDASSSEVARPRPRESLREPAEPQEDAPTTRRTLPVNTEEPAPPPVWTLFVTDRSGHPLTGAWVLRVDRRESQPSGRTDDDGRVTFEFDGQDEGVTPEFTVRCAGYVDASVRFPTREPVIVALDALPGIRGQLFDSDGAPVTTRGRVRLGVLSAGSSSLERRQTELEADGSFRFSGLPVGRLAWISGMAEGFVETRRELEFDLRPERTDRFDLTLRGGVTVVGTVVDSANGNPVAGAHVWTNDYFWGESDLGPHTYADENGRFRLEEVDTRTGNANDVRARSLWIFAAAEGHKSKREPCKALWDEEHELYRVEVSVDAAQGVVAGVIFEPDGETPAPGVRILKVDATGNANFSKTESDGTFRFETVPPGPVDLLAWRGELTPAGACLTATHGARIEAGANATVELTLTGAPDAHLGGRVTDTEGRPMQGVTIRADLLYRREGLTIGALARTRVATNEDGEYTFRGLPPARFAIAPELEASRASEPQRFEIDLAQEERTESHDFRLGRAVAFAGTLRADTRHPSSFSLLLVEPETQRELGNTYADGEGHFAFRQVLAGAYEIHVLDRETVVEVVPVGPEGTESLELFLAF